MTTIRDRSPIDRKWSRLLPALQRPWLPGLDRGGLITGVLGLVLGGVYLVPLPYEGRAVSLETGGQIPCARLRGQPMQTCGVSLQRPGLGKASLQVIHPNGMERELVFRNGTFLGCQKGMEGCGELAVQVATEDQLRLLRVGNERYEIPGSYLLGR
ncbi:MAG: hypothetical protein ACO3ZD_04355 [Cyanobium sp.]